jgi:hypothetical protein
MVLLMSYWRQAGGTPRQVAESPGVLGGQVPVLYQARVDEQGRPTRAAETARRPRTCAPPANPRKLDAACAMLVL